MPLNDFRRDAERFRDIDRAFMRDLERRDRKLSDTGNVPTPPRGNEGLPIPESQDPLRR